MRNTARIREINDLFRQTFLIGKVYLTEGIRALSESAQSNIIEAIQNYSKWDSGNDPYNEHDFGSLDTPDGKVFWKIDYYDKSMEYGSDDPSDPKVTTRVMTIMLAREY